MSSKFLAEQILVEFPHNITYSKGQRTAYVALWLHSPEQTHPHSFSILLKLMFVGPSTVLSLTWGDVSMPFVTLQWLDFQNCMF